MRHDTRRHRLTTVLLATVCLIAAALAGVPARAATIPDTTITSGPTQPISTSSSATFTFTSDDPAATFECSRDGLPYFACTSPRTETNFGNNFHNFFVRAKNSAGTDPTPARWGWTVDTTGGGTVPDTVIDSGPTQPVSTSSSATFTFHSVPAGATFECSRDGLPYFACSSPWMETNFGNNFHNFFVRAKNSAGTDPTPARWGWTVNAGSGTVPDTTITSGPTRPVSTSNSATFTFTSDDPAATFECSRDGLPYFTCSSPRTETHFADSFHNFFVRARNSAGTDPSPAVWSWTVDAVQNPGEPQTTITSGPSRPISTSSSATFTFESDDPAATFECSRDGLPYFACSSPRTETNFADSFHNFFVRAKNSSGTDSTPAQWSWTVDAVPDGTGPNILLINTDDQQGAGTLGVMPKTRKWFGEQGTTFPNATVATPVCCPSRSTLYSGRYIHNNGNLNNQTTKNLDQSATIMRYLKDAGYQTGMAGKFLLEWPNSTPPPYFDYWALTAGGYVDVQYGTDQGPVTAAYTTTEMTRQGIRMLNNFENNDAKPFFLYLAPQAPHSPFTAESKYANADVGPCVLDPSASETDRSDKPIWVQWWNVDNATGCSFRQSQLRTLLSVDDMVDAVMTRLTELGEADNTIAIFTSDNGYMWGDHGLRSKFFPYTNSIGVPFMLRWPGKVAAGAVDNRMLSNVDITPSLLAALGLNPALKYPFDGRPFLNTSGLVSQTRSELYFEYFRDRDRDIPTWRAIKTPGLHYIEYYDENGARIYQEYYDMVADPYQNTNLFADGNPANPDVSSLVTRLNRYRTCIGTTGTQACA